MTPRPARPRLDSSDDGPVKGRSRERGAEGAVGESHDPAKMVGLVRPFVGGKEESVKRQERDRENREREERERRWTNGGLLCPR
jgi:hypothetical protein